MSRSRRDDEPVISSTVIPSLVFTCPSLSLACVFVPACPYSPMGKVKKSTKKFVQRQLTPAIEQRKTRKWQKKNETARHDKAQAQETAYAPPLPLTLSFSFILSKFLL